MWRTADGQAKSYTYPVDSNRLDAVSGANAQSLSYDAVGNTVAKGPLAFGYNDANRLSSVSASGAPLATYRYNARGERVSKSERRRHHPALPLRP